MVYLKILHLSYFLGQGWPWPPSRIWKSPRVTVWEVCVCVLLLIRNSNSKCFCGSTLLQESQDKFGFFSRFENFLVFVLFCLLFISNPSQSEFIEFKNKNKSNQKVPSIKIQTCGIFDSSNKGNEQKHGQSHFVETCTLHSAIPNICQCSVAWYYQWNWTWRSEVKLIFKKLSLTSENRRRHCLTLLSKLKMTSAIQCQLEPLLWGWEVEARGVPEIEA